MFGVVVGTTTDNAATTTVAATRRRNRFTTAMDADDIPEDVDKDDTQSDDGVSFVKNTTRTKNDTVRGGAEFSSVRLLEAAGCVWNRRRRGVNVNVGT